MVGRKKKDMGEFWGPQKGAPPDLGDQFRKRKTKGAIFHMQALGFICLFNLFGSRNCLN